MYTEKMIGGRTVQCIHEQIVCNLVWLELYGNLMTDEQKKKMQKDIEADRTLIKSPRYDYWNT